MRLSIFFYLLLVIFLISCSTKNINNLNKGQKLYLEWDVFYDSKKIIQWYYVDDSIYFYSFNKDKLLNSGSFRSSLNEKEFVDMIESKNKKFCLQSGDWIKVLNNVNGQYTLENVIEFNAFDCLENLESNNTSYQNLFLLDVKTIRDKSGYIFQKNSEGVEQIINK